MHSELNTSAIRWALQTRIPRAPTKLLLVAIAARCDAGGTLHLDHSVGRQLAIECGLRMKSLPDRMVELINGRYLIETEHGVMLTRRST